MEQAGQEWDLGTEAHIHSCDFWLHSASLVTVALPGTACSCASQLCIRQERCFHWAIPLSTPRERAGEQGRETDRAVTDGGGLRLLASALQQIPGHNHPHDLVGTCSRMEMQRKHS